MPLECKPISYIIFLWSLLRGFFYFLFCIVYSFAIDKQNTNSRTRDRRCGNIFFFFFRKETSDICVIRLKRVCRYKLLPYALRLRELSCHFYRGSEIIDTSKLLVRLLNVRDYKLNNIRSLLIVNNIRPLR